MKNVPFHQQIYFKSPDNHSVKYLTQIAKHVNFVTVLTFSQAYLSASMVLVSEFIISSTSSLILQGRALIPTVKHERRDGSSSANPYMAFRKRTEKMQTRKVSLSTSRTSSSKQYLHAYYMCAVGTMFSVCRYACEGTIEHTKWFTSTCTL